MSKPALNARPLAARKERIFSWSCLWATTASSQAKGFQKYVQEGTSLDVNPSATVTVHLAVGMTSEEIHVHADAALVDTAASSLGKTVEERDVVDLPLNGRNFSQLGFLQPGVVQRNQFGGTFGEITEALPGRLIQVALKFLF